MIFYGGEKTQKNISLYHWILISKLSKIIPPMFPTACTRTETDDFLLHFLLAPLSALPSGGRGADARLLHRCSPRPVDGQQGGRVVLGASQGSGGARVWLRERVRVVWPPRAQVRLHLQHQRHGHQQRVQRLPQRRHTDESRWRRTERCSICLRFKKCSLFFRCVCTALFHGFFLV